MIAKSFIVGTFGLWHDVNFSNFFTIESFLLSEFSKSDILNTISKSAFSLSLRMFGSWKSSSTNFFLLFDLNTSNSLSTFLRFKIYRHVLSE